MINQENALVSIIVPIYGTEKYLKKCVDSIIKQTLTAEKERQRYGGPEYLSEFPPKRSVS